MLGYDLSFWHLAIILTNEELLFIGALGQSSMNTPIVVQ